mmetsp:Transcript_132356/g.247419  ORF Transcript_132356/g.247419 Transcript_132356/m.247419 type:complete len:613 (-) Transcript_132356:258-2096(-)
MGQSNCTCKKPAPAEDAAGEVPADQKTMVQPVKAVPWMEETTTMDDLMMTELTRELTEGEESVGAGTVASTVADVAEACNLTQEDQTVGDHVVPVLGSKSVGYFVEKDKLTKLLDASGEDLGRNFSLDGSSINATKKGNAGGFACAVSDPTESDCPLVFVSPGFVDLTGYTSEFATGRSCRFLQPTSKVLNDNINMEERKIMREFCSFVQPAGTTIINLLLNQRFTGERFWNLLRMQYVVVDGDCYIFAVQTNLDAYMPKPLLKAVKSQAKNESIVKALGPFMEALSRMRKEVRAMASLPMMELKGYFTACMNHLQMLPVMNKASPDKSLTEKVEAPVTQLFKPGEVVEVTGPIKYPSFQLAKGNKGKISAMDSFGNIVVEWEDSKIGTKGVLKRDFNLLKSMGGGAAAGDSLHQTWQKLYDVLANQTGAETAEGVANSHSQYAREEIARKLIINHRAVINDLTNTSKTKNIEDKPLTQTHLVRVDAGSRPFVDQMLREVARRLLGHRPGLASYVETPEKSNATQCAAWRGTAIYLSGRIQSKPEQKPGRKPDMSEAAAAAFLAVLEEVAASACAKKEDAKALSASMAETRKNFDGTKTPVTTPRSPRSKKK